MNEPDIGSLLSGLSDEDFERLNDMAQQFLGGMPGTGENAKKEPQPPQGDPFGGIDADMMAKLMKILPLLQSRGDDERTRLILALKPLLSEPRRKKADEALQLLRLMDVLPLLGTLGDFRS